MNEAPLQPYASVNPDSVGIKPPGYRLPSGTRVGRVILQVANLERSLGFYRDVIGFRELDRSDGVARLGVPSAPDALLELVERPGVKPVPRGGLLGLYHFAVLLPTRADLGRFMRHAHLRGAQFGGADHLYSEALYLIDPDGLTIEVYRDRPREEWSVRAGEFVATSDPLDMEGVLHAGGNEPFEGLPAATTIGHMHLYVGDIPRAAAFYHDALGFDKTTWSWAPTALFLAAGAYHHHLGLNTWAAHTRIATDDDARMLEWQLILPDGNAVEQAARSLEESGSPVKRVSGGDALAQDEWRNCVRLKADSTSY